ncbi:hypothetical protein [Mycobacteroides abscessus]|uniref:hypothetical protein n=1 Tax=Mycobacteroides abscessus TaxID=36809 RepID=UPI0009277C05|nr:hypothetical protein [Mycobacteroides abscessus]MBN7379729.1 hypothetical protein [Mycobacteroides abscessus subsp. massiliense]MBN7507846.1 hypothetical protein [Mycobacteroides abscessus subsp. massiliense]MDM2096363.1 hypothetical protein [Mycobacteroides abscessus]MDM2121094.1 hypothetical protein [Mycobacteroides abscessus]MDM2124411.1 hypothetical protein [Mycobacteroides abscessus]
MTIYGMNELRFVKDPASDDYLAEGGDGEYYASHFEGEFIAAAWTCEEDGLRALLGVFETVAEPGNFAIEASLPGGRVVDEIDLYELQGLAHFRSHEFETMTLRIPDRLFFWSRKTVSSESANESLGEIGFVTKKFDTEILKAAIKTSASAAIRKNALELISYHYEG